jgi:hypothetical protein
VPDGKKKAVSISWAELNGCFIIKREIKNAMAA